MAVSELVAPAFRSVPPHSSTAGPDAAELAESAGLDLDLEQRLVLDTLLVEDEDGHWAAYEACVIQSRQNGKTRCLQAVALADLFLFGAELTTWSAHLFDTAQEAFRDLVDVIDGAPHLSKQVKTVHRARGDEGIELLDGRRLNFLARSRTGGRGLAGQRVVLDEAFALTDAEMGSLLPTLSAQPNAQAIYASTACMLGSSILRGIRDRGRAGGDPTLAYIEWADPVPGGCDDPRCVHQLGTSGCALDDLERIRSANPTLGRRIPVARVLAERRALPPTEFARERLGWHEDPPVGEGGAFDHDLWLRLADTEAEPGEARPAFGVDIGVDRLAHIAVAFRRADGRIQVMLTARREGRGERVDSGLSPFEAPARLKELAARWKGSTVWAGGTTIGLAAEVPGAQLVSGPEFATACGRFDDMLREQRIRHGNQGQLSEAVRAARWRPMGQAGERTLQLRDSPAVGPLAAVVRALHGVLVAPKPIPPPPLVGSGGSRVRDGVGDLDDVLPPVDRAPDPVTMRF